MYSPDRIAARLEIAATTYGIIPEYHSVDEVDKFNSYLTKSAYSYTDTGELVQSRPFTEFESRWMLNERVLCMSDASYFLTRYAYVKDEAGNIRRFQFRMPQRLYYDIIADLEQRGAAIELQILKARQLGISTITELLLAHRIIFGYGVNAILGSADVQKTFLMAKMLLLTYDLLPQWLRPQYTRRVESDRGLLEFASTQSGVSFQHGSQMSGIGRGTTPTVYHLSEVASFTDPEAQIEASLFKAVHASPNIFGVLESTAEGNDNWWAEKWRYNKANWASGASRLRPLFLPWFCGLDIYPTPTWAETHPIPEGWTPARETREHAASAALFVASDTLLRKHLGSDWQLPRVQQWFWEVGYREAKQTGTESTWAQEMAADDVTCFISSYESVFGNSVITVADSSRIRDYAEYGIIGTGIAEQNEPSTEDVDYSAPRIPLAFTNHKGDTYRWELVPLLPEFPADADWRKISELGTRSFANRLLIYHPPKPGVDYSIGVDTSSGLGEGHDNTAAEVCAIGKRGLPDIQVAEWASPFIGHVDAFAPVLAIATLYRSKMDRNIIGQSEPLVSVEQLAAVGETVQLQLRQMGYRRFFKFTRDYAARNVSQKKKDSNRQGFYTTAWTRPMLVDGFIHAAKNNWITVNSPFVIAEMDKFEIHLTKSGKTKQEHAAGEHDDRLIALAISTFCAHDLDLIAERGKQKYQPQLDTRPPVDIGPYQSNLMPTKPRNGHGGMSPAEFSTAFGIAIDERFNY